MEFMLGCNYWASNAGADMWRNFDIESIRKDLKTLSSHGVKYMRVFPNWREFQPVIPQMAAQGYIAAYDKDYGAKGDNPYFLDETMLDRFSAFLDVCDEYGMKLVVGILTGWMSGALFIPSALYGKNLLTDPTALYFEQLFIKGFVERFRHRECIYAWDLGNECNCLSPVANRFEAANWTAVVSNAIRSADPDRMIISGMHGLGTEGNWTLQDQGMLTDMLTTHPYPLWCEHTRSDETLSLRTTSHATAQSKFYAEVGKRPCLAEEIGTMGPMICSDDVAADFLRTNLFSLWANGATGVMWWCASDQTNLSTFPYSVQMVELELGMMRVDGTPKPVLKEMKCFAEFLSDSKIALPKAKTDAVCILTRDVRQWGIAYVSHILSRQAGFNLEFCYGDEELPDADIYMMPSINAYQVLPKNRYEQLMQKVSEGASLYLSVNAGVLCRFEELTGLKVIDSFDTTADTTVDLDGKVLSFTRNRTYQMAAVGAKVLCCDSDGNPFIAVNCYGKGKVFVVNAPVEDNLIDCRDAFSGHDYEIYRRFMDEAGYDAVASVDDPEIALTYHPAQDTSYIVLVNHSGENKNFTLYLKDCYSVDAVCYGDMNHIKAYDACVFRIKNERGL